MAPPRQTMPAMTTGRREPAPRSSRPAIASAAPISASTLGDTRLRIAPTIGLSTAPMMTSRANSSPMPAVSRPRPTARRTGRIGSIALVTAEPTAMRMTTGHDPPTRSTSRGVAGSSADGGVGLTKTTRRTPSRMRTAAARTKGAACP